MRILRKTNDEEEKDKRRLSHSTDSCNLDLQIIDKYENVGEKL